MFLVVLSAHNSNLKTIFGVDRVSFVKSVYFAMSKLLSTSPVAVGYTDRNVDGCRDNRILNLSLESLQETSW